MVEEAILGFLKNTVIKSLQGFGYIEAKVLKRESWDLTDEGKKYAAEGSPEFHFFSAVPEEGRSISIDDLKRMLDPSVFHVGSKQAPKKKWVAIFGKQVSRTVQHVVEDKVKVEMLLQIQQGVEELDKESLKSLKTRKLVVYPQRRGRATLMSWSSRSITNFNAKGQPILDAGHLHPLLKVRKQFKDIFCQMGFEEMPTNNFVESSFWNFDALFQPQQHPAPDSHDTFFLKSPPTTRELPEDYVERVRQVHESGGYDYEWKREEANKNLLRTHTTAVSSRMLYALAKESSPFPPKQYFSTDRPCLQKRGCRPNPSRRGCPSYVSSLRTNPYTEPSMEIFGYHEGKGKWLETGNSGMFRPEMLQPMGLPEDVRVIAWGLSLERPTMILYDIDNIRGLFGHKVNLAKIKQNRLCRIGIESA
ncbi:hypothetical protein Bca52824_083724 [Brassica carinata]|uniref:phenylalanine--tRNA ligase n=2 Tax=Brassica carinata TaxID=52824 RepID=A0A8X7PMF2_BRACI|nr:hypothetical protein Bca52824_083724 [Brassica carinata]